ncbi:MAG: T9SS type A sorting domain-containing protein [Melioribacteraceae bacterium]|nr:T9SS type A sorting domain-containing protein [Melioribacteraceae bacterium]
MALKRITIIIICLNIFAFAESEDGKKHLPKNSADVHYSFFNINNISTSINNNGEMDNYSGSNSFEFPQGSNANLVYASGLVWGAKINDELRVGGSTFNSGLQPGAILDNGKAEDPSSENVRVFRVRPDWETAELSNDLSYNETDQEVYRNQYQKDWNEWPAEKGAPFNDVNNNGIYESTIDIPGVPGANQTLWYVANDLNPEKTNGLYGSLPMEIEVQVTVWGYSSTDLLNSTMFKKYKVINKSSNTFEDMYFSFWTDDDLGDSADDLIGYDTSLAAAYEYNSNNIDGFYGVSVPALGYYFLKTPINSEPNQIGTTGHYHIYKGSLYNSDPDGTKQFYNLFEGKYSDSGETRINPLTGKADPFSFNGNPVNGTGWIDGVEVGPGDRRHGIYSGTIDMKPGDTQEIVVAQTASFGKNNLNAITEMKKKVYNIKKSYESSFSNIADLPINSIELSSEDIYNKIEVSWTKSTKFENHSDNGYKFEGYKIYQLPTAMKSSKPGELLEVQDLNNGIQKIDDLVYDPNSETTKHQTIFNGNNSGLNYNFTLNWDHINNTNLVSGKPYYVGISAVFYNPGADDLFKVYETGISIIECKFYDEELAYHYNETFNAIHENGNSDCEVNVTVVDPGKLTGDKYKLSFTDQIHYLDEQGWKVFDQQILDKDIYPASISAKVYPVLDNEYELKIRIKNLELSSDGSYADSLKIILPSNIEIVRTYPGFNYYIVRSYVNNNLNTVIWKHEQPQNIEGGEILPFDNFIVTLKNVNLPFNIEYKLYDDDINFEQNKDAEGNVTVSNFDYYRANLVKTELFNQTKNKLVIKDYVIEAYNFSDKWFQFNQQFPTIDGFTVNFNFFNTSSYPSFRALTYVEGVKTRSVNWLDVNYPQDFFGTAETDSKILRQSYELKLDGIIEATEQDGKIIKKVKAGTGSIATIYGAGNYELKDHPLNSNSYTNAPFAIRVPFKIYNKDNGKKINLAFYDKGQTLSQNQFSAFPNRVQCALINAPYNEKVNNPFEESVAKNITWLVDLSYVYNEDAYKIELDVINATEPGIDEYIFTTYMNETDLPDDYVLYQNYPNPFNPTTKILFKINTTQKVKIEVFDILGRKVETLIDKDYLPGTYKVDFNGTNLSSGVYVYRIETNNFTRTKKMLLLK